MLMVLWATGGTGAGITTMVGCGEECTKLPKTDGNFDSWGRTALDSSYQMNFHLEFVRW